MLTLAVPYILPAVRGTGPLLVGSMPSITNELREFRTRIYPTANPSLRRIFWTDARKFVTVLLADRTIPQIRWRLLRSDCARIGEVDNRSRVKRATIACWRKGERRVASTSRKCATVTFVQIIDFPNNYSEHRHPLLYTNAHTNARTHARTHACTNTCTRTCAHAHTCTVRKIAS